MSKATLWKLLLQNILGREKMHAKLPTFSKEHLTKTACGMKSLLISFSSRKNPLTLLNKLSGPQAPSAMNPVDLPRALPKTAWHPECCCCSGCWEILLNGTGLLQAHLGIWDVRVGKLSCRMNVISVLMIWILPGSQRQLVASYSERWGFRVQLSGICHLSKQKYIRNTSEIKCWAAERYRRFQMSPEGGSHTEEEAGRAESGCTSPWRNEGWQSWSWGEAQPPESYSTKSLGSIDNKREGGVEHSSQISTKGCVHIQGPGWKTRAPKHWSCQQSSAWSKTKTLDKMPYGQCCISSFFQPDCWWKESCSGSHSLLSSCTFLKSCCSAPISTQQSHGISSFQLLGVTPNLPGFLSLCAMTFLFFLCRGNIGSPCWIIC